MNIFKKIFCSKAIVRQISTNSRLELLKNLKKTWQIKNNY